MDIQREERPAASYVQKASRYEIFSAQVVNVNDITRYTGEHDLDLIVVTDSHGRWEWEVVAITANGAAICNFYRFKRSSDG